jgi:hypothetical protein
MVFDKKVDVDIGSSEFIFLEILKVVLIHFVPYIDGLAKMTVVPAVIYYWLCV